MPEFELLCPHCQARLTVDSDLHAVVSSTAFEPPKTFETFDAALGATKAQASEREARFEASLAAEKTKKEVLDKKFEDLFKKAQSDTSRPIRDIDLE